MRSLNDAFQKLRNLSSSREVQPDRRELIAQKRAATKERMKRAVSLAGKAIPHDSLLYDADSALSPKEVEEAVFFLKELGPVTPKNWSLHLHIRRVGEYAKRLLEQLQASRVQEFQSIDPYRAQIQGLFHDIGKVAGQFGYLRTEYEGDSILKKLEMEHLIVDTVRLGSRFKTLEQLTPLEKLIMYADICGGVDAKNPAEIVPYEKRLEIHKQTRTLRSYTEYIGELPALPSELSGLLNLDRGDKDRYTALYQELDKYFQKLGADREKIRKEIMESEKDDPSYQAIVDIGGFSKKP